MACSSSRIPKCRGNCASAASGQVVQATLEAARAQDVKVTPRCGFVARYIAEHREFQDLLA
jgi:predicted GNAT family acetyltransferase